jgi:4-amino-4-deoxy-L-arabinose transferase-like glycosyltransferase
MGGRFPGRFPPGMRIAAVVQVVIYGLMGAVVFARAGLILPDMLEVSRVAIWVVVALMAVALVLNLITPSRWERRLWAPVAAAMLTASLWVALAEVR